MVKTINMVLTINMVKTIKGGPPGGGLCLAGQRPNPLQLVLVADRDPDQALGAKAGVGFFPNSNHGKNQTPECSPGFGGPLARNPLIAGGAVLTENMVFEKTINPL